MPQLEKNPCVITRANGSVEYSVYTREGAGPMEHLVHLSTAPSGHSTVIDYDSHPGYHCEHTPAVLADKVRKFLELDGHKFLGHPNDRGVARDAELARVKAKHGLPEPASDTV
jgi:hypothetical protein